MTFFRTSFFAVVAAISLAASVPAFAADAPAEDCGCAEPAKPAEDCGCAAPAIEPVNRLEQYLERRGERLDEEMENVMKPMEKGEGIRGTEPEKGTDDKKE